jgi:hypothetical protein
MRYWVKTVFAVLLLPLCFGAAVSIVEIVRLSGTAHTFWVAFGSGAACWLVIFLILPKPMWAYVVGHELTHALCVWLQGGKVKRFRATAQGGHVVVNRTNFVVALAPYFFPIYAAVVFLSYLAGDLAWGWRPFLPSFHLLLGAAYAFHISLTWHVLKVRQPDIAEQGYFFSAVVIWLGNAAVLLLGIPLLTDQVQVSTALELCVSETARVLQQILVLIRSDARH